MGVVTTNELNWLKIYSLIVKLAKIYHICYKLTAGQYIGAASKVVGIEVSAKMKITLIMIELTVKMLRKCWLI